jgi:hypothetical protein
MADWQREPTGFHCPDALLFRELLVHRMDTASPLRSEVLAPNRAKRRGPSPPDLLTVPSEPMTLPERLFHHVSYRRSAVFRDAVVVLAIFRKKPAMHIRRRG